jgi:ribosome-associated protein
VLEPDTLERLQLAVRAALDKKAFQVIALEVAELTTYTDSLLLCSGGSDRQVGAIAAAVEDRLRAAGHRPLHVEGAPRSDWILLDYGEFIVHVLTEEKRAYYALDALWGDAARLDQASLGVAAGARATGR